MFGIIRYFIILEGLFLLPLMSISAARTPLMPREEMASVNRLTGANAYPNLPCIRWALHDVGNMGLTITNRGVFGSGFFRSLTDDLFEPTVSCIYPYPGRISYLFSGSYWVGAVVGKDTLVSVGADGWQWIYEMWPDTCPTGEIIERSINTHDPEAISQQDYIAVWTDTTTDPGIISPPLPYVYHYPLNIKMTQRSYAWGFSYAEDFVIFDCTMENIGSQPLREVYIGIYVDADVKVHGESGGFDDDISGFKRTVPSFQGCGFIDTVDVAWTADFDGRSDSGLACPDGFELTSVTGLRFLGLPTNDASPAFSWWVSHGNPAIDFGPRQRGTSEDPFRNFGDHIGTPDFDGDKYYIMSHGEIDYDQIYTTLDHSGEGWLAPPEPDIAQNLADGGDTRYLLSFGPLDLYPGQTLPFVFAYIGGENFHTDCWRAQEIYNPYAPSLYDQYFDFTDLGRNAVWASWVFDNPGYDTDGDGYAGRFRLCAADSELVIDTVSVNPLTIDSSFRYQNADTLYYTGDGTPDYRGAAPPPSPPRLRIDSRLINGSEGELRIKWNGLVSETTPDRFRRHPDFEGYRVYYSLTPEESGFSLAAAYDRENFIKYVWNENPGHYAASNRPFTLDSLRKIYGADFDPYRFTRTTPYKTLDSTFYFEPLGWNVSLLEDTNFIHKVYPEQPHPTTLNLDSARMYYPEELTADGYFKYFEYQFVLRHLLPSQLYYMVVTAFDYGAPGTDLESLESPFRDCMAAEYAQNSARLAESGNLAVIAYPNPFRIDASYIRNEDGSPAGGGAINLVDPRARRIHFINLPHRCTIRIFTLDGDLVRLIRHDSPEGTEQAMHDSWDLLTDDGFLVVAGIYYFAVESIIGNQVGKLVIIL